MESQMKKIKFVSTNVSLLLATPKPASKEIPEWYKKIDGVANGNPTIKKCMPVLDAFTAGYFIVLAADVHFKNGHFQEISKVPMVLLHTKDQIGELSLPKEYNKQPYKWVNYFLTKTPKGYSSMFTHPINRPDLPFYTMTGIVDTDTFPVPVNFPFFIREDFDGIIPEGTPIAQVIPFKREDWKADVDVENQSNPPVSFLNNIFSPPFNFYKRNFWKRKKYQ
jgi:hypothetical protein